MKKGSSGGMAAILDSLMFVCIISAIALLVIESPSNNEKTETWDQTSMIHSVLVHSTISMGTDGEADFQSEAVVTDLSFEALGAGDQQLMDRLSTQLESMADALVEVPYHYRWIITGASNEMVMGESILPDSCDIMASRIEADLGGNIFTSIFYLWIL